MTLLRYGLLDRCLALEDLGAAGQDAATALAGHSWDDRGLVARAAYAVGVGRGCLELAQERAADRVISGHRLLEFQGPAHRLANVAVLLVTARVGVQRAAAGEDAATPAGSLAASCAAASVAAAVAAAHELVQVYGAAGTSDRQVVHLYRLAYALAHECGSPHLLWRQAGQGWLSETSQLTSQSPEES